MRDLEDEGVRAFAKSFDGALETIARKRQMFGEDTPDIGDENGPKETEFGDLVRSRAATGQGILKQIP